ncbi:DUF7282 domain-containing protein [Natrinema caseinilyticum]|uniref:DUF7282 domain-containing protein n=1 Tax=Natrinema caseinilyticum TaxID=2961570 RepID=UPI0020C49E32|nr:hypothetical protein [Natrinema caseinilyticum]
MNARNQLLVVVTALMLVFSSGAMVAAASNAGAMDEDTAVSDDESELTNNETTNETVEDGADVAEDDTNETNETQCPCQPAYVTFEDQTTDGDTVVVQNVTLASPGFVTIHNSSLLVGNVIGSVIGTSEYLEAGTHENVTITLDDPLEEDETLIAMPHRDTNGNQTYDFVETEGLEDGPFLTADGEPVTDDAVVTVETAADEEPVDEEPVDDEEPVEDNVTDEEPIDEEDNVTDEEPVDDEEDEEPVDVPVDEEDNVTDEMPMDELPVDGTEPIFIIVENPTIEELNVENVTVNVLVVGEDIDADEIADQIGDITEDNVTVEEPVDEEDNVTDEEPIDEEDNVTDEEPVDEEDNVTDEEPVDEEDNVTDEEPIEENVTEEPPAMGDNITEDNVTEDNVTEEEPVDEEDNVTEDNVTEEEPEEPAEPFNVTDLEAPDSATVGENITVNATVENPADEEGTEAIQFRLQGDLVAEQNLTLEGGESDTVEFEVDTTDIPPGEYIHMVLADETGEVATIELLEDTEEIDETENGDLENETDTDTDDVENETANESAAALGFAA